MKAKAKAKVLKVTEVILDATQLNILESCPQKWYLDHYLNLTPAKTNSALSTGSYFHEVLKKYYELGQSAPPVSNHIRAAVRLAEELAKGPESIKWPRVRANPDFHIERLKQYLIKTMYEDDLSEIIAVEKGFSYLLYEDADRRYILEGMIDLISIEPRMGLTVTDHKTQQRFDTIYPYNHQCSNYLIATGAKYFRYNYIGQQETVGTNTFHRPIFCPPPGYLDQWKKDVLNTFRRAEEYLKELDELKLIVPQMYDSEGASCFPRNRAACDSKYGTCAFHRLCELPNNSKWKSTVLTAYKQKESKWKAWS